jgi:hypothetical protein
MSSCLTALPCQVDWFGSQTLYFRIPDLYPRALQVQIIASPGATHQLSFSFLNIAFDLIGGVDVSVSGPVVIHIGTQGGSVPAGWESFIHRIADPLITFVKVDSLRSSLASRRLLVSRPANVYIDIFFMADGGCRHYTDSL